MEQIGRHGRVIYLVGLTLLVLGLILALAGSGLIGILIGVIGFAALVVGLFGEERYGEPDR